jgi:hypothetical protein
MTTYAPTTSYRPPSRPGGLVTTTSSYRLDEDNRDSPTRTTSTSTSTPTTSTPTVNPFLAQGTAWNTAVDGYNNALSGFQSQFSGLQSQIGGLDLTKLWDNPNTTANENPYQSLQTAISGLKTGLGGLKLDLSKPIYKGDTTGLPTLKNANSTLYQQLMSGVGSIESQLGSIFQARQAEEQRVNGFRTQLMGGLNPIQNMAGALSIRDLNAIIDQQNQLGALDAKRQGFSSSIIDQMGGWGDFTTKYQTLNNTLSGLRTKRTEEEKRIADFERMLYSQADQLGGQLGGMTIADQSGMNSIKAKLQALQQDAGRFTSELDWDFSQEMGHAGLGGVMANLNSLFQDRTNEENRIKQFEADLRNRALGLQDLSGGLSEYNLNHLNTLQSRIAAMRGEAGGFSSALGFDFSQELGGLTEAEARLAELKSTRATKLAELQGRTANPMTGLQDLAVHDETGLNQRRNQLQSLLTELSQWTGSDTAGIKAQLDGGMSTVQGKLPQLQTKRSELEKQAQTIRDRIKNQSYYASTALGADDAEAKSMKDQIDLYNAQQAMDELDQIMGRLGSERSRLVADEGATANRKQAEMNAVLAAMGGGGVPQFGLYPGANPALAGQYRYNNAPPEEELLAPVRGSAFSMALGLGG